MLCNCCCNILIPSADSAPREALLLYKVYFFRSSCGDRLGMTTFAPANIPRSRPSGVSVARAVVDGISAEGYIRRKIDNKSSVCSSVPLEYRAKGVS